MEMDAWSARREQLLMWAGGVPELIPAKQFVDLMKSKPKPPRVRLQQQNNVIRLIVQPRKCEAPNAPTSEASGDQPPAKETERGT
jgi:hypothetical protein